MLGPKFANSAIRCAEIEQAGEFPPKWLSVSAKTLNHFGGNSIAFRRKLTSEMASDGRLLQQLQAPQVWLVA